VSAAFGLRFLFTIIKQAAICSWARPGNEWQQTVPAPFWAGTLDIFPVSMSITLAFAYRINREESPGREL